MRADPIFEDDVSQHPYRHSTGIYKSSQSRLIIIKSSQFQAGAAAAFTVDLLVYPLDTIKTRMQSPEYRQRYVNGATQAVKKRLLFRGLYQGVGSVIIATLPSCPCCPAFFELHMP